MIDVVDLTKDLIACTSVTPVDAGAQTLIADALEKMGFECHHLPFGEGHARVPNLFARLGTSAPHICFAGHTDVVPPGPDSEWTHGPFNPTIQDGVLYGRGASDMKGSVAAFVASISEYLDKHGVPDGSISLLITGDEEADAINGTVKVLEWMDKHDQIPDVALVGEPTNPDHMGQEIKIGRRGSLTGHLSASGTQGHVAYPHRAHNPLPQLIDMLSALKNTVFDNGTEFFAPTNLEITTIDVGNAADNVIPGAAKVMFNIRFNDLWSSDSLITKIHDILKTVSDEYDIEFRRGAESFMTQPNQWTDVVMNAIKDVVENTENLKYTTTGGTSDARFIRNYCPVVEYGPINRSIHRINENVNINDLQTLTDVYVRVLERYFEN